ncbi:MAG: hypothetical protein E7174_00325 [Firmicutes bacterium]|nr:hypothetical protein [Bacillota bacterium]
MFGEKPLFGQVEISVDKKGRICIPATTKREPGEELVILYNKQFDVHEIYSVKSLEDRFNKLNNLIENAQNKNDQNFYKKSLYELSKSILRSEIVDLQGRILTGKIFEGEEKVLSTGAYNHLIIKPIKKK